MAKKNEISRTGTYTSSDDDTKTYYYKGFTATEITEGSDGYSGTDYYSNDDLENESIFVDIDSKVSLKFTQEIDSSSSKLSISQIFIISSPLYAVYISYGK